MPAKSVTTLSAAESKRFLSALAKPFAPNAALRRALKRGDALPPPQASGGGPPIFSIEELDPKRHDRAASTAAWSR